MSLCYRLTGHELTRIHREWFKLKESFSKGNLLVRNDYGDPLRTIYLTNEIVKVTQVSPA